MTYSIRCAISGCVSTLETNEPVAAEARFICRHHPRREQVEAANRPYDPVGDNTDREVHFQDYQFDPEMARSARPSGTEKDKFDYESEGEARL